MSRIVDTVDMTMRQRSVQLEQIRLSRNIDMSPSASRAIFSVTESDKPTVFDVGRCQAPLSFEDRRSKMAAITDASLFGSRPVIGVDRLKELPPKVALGNRKVDRSTEDEVDAGARAHARAKAGREKRVRTE
jgi:hypothetical protein